jgi:hypothetical protein
VKWGLEYVRGVSDCRAFASREHVLRTELTGLLADLLARRGVEVRSRRVFVAQLLVDK